MNSFARCFALLLLTVVASGVAWAQDKPRGEKPKPNERLLQDLLKRFPDADADKDGILTREEAQAYRKKIETQRGKQAPGKKQAPSLPAIKPTHADVKYGPYERTVLDFYQAKSSQPTPLVIHIHGGGFVAGNKNSFNSAMVKAMLDTGISFASIHYRFVDGKGIIFPAPQRDGARAVQFLRWKAKEWNLDPQRVACFGGSAGAGISMWIGFHDDLADPKSSDPVLRQSTRIQAIGTFGGQGTYDPIKIKELIGGRAWEHPSLLKVYGLRSLEDALHPTAEMQKLYDEGSAITHLTKDDPPLYMVYSPDDPLAPNARPGAGIHHFNFGKQLKAKMDDLGIENVFVYTPEAKGRNVAAEMLDFFRKQLAKVK